MGDNRIWRYDMYERPGFAVKPNAQQNKRANNPTWKNRAPNKYTYFIKMANPTWEKSYWRI